MQESLRNIKNITVHPTADPISLFKKVQLTVQDNSKVSNTHNMLYDVWFGFKCDTWGYKAGSC